MSEKSFYITTTLPYVNAEPHVGFAMELIRADVIARYKKLTGFEVFFNTGTDEHGQKLLKDAEKAGKGIEEYVDRFATIFGGLKDLMGISDGVHFIRTTNEHHMKAAQAFWKLVADNGYLYKKEYEAKYCVGCELEKTESELNEKGECALHPGRPIEIISEENYFFKFSEFQKPLLEFYDTHPQFVIPESRFNEIRSFVERGLRDFSVSRLKSKMSWGVPVPGDPDHVMYVWFDALVNYISTLGWPEDTATYEKFWIHGTPTQYCGKDNLRQQTAMWQAMLMAAKLAPTHQVIINGFFTGDGGIKMSKSIGNVVNPYDVVGEYGSDALRFFVCSEVSMFEDSPFTMERFKESYNAKLANGLGNLTSRIMKMAETNLEIPISIDESEMPHNSLYANAFDEFNIKDAVGSIWAHITQLDESIQKDQPFKLVKDDKEKGIELIKNLVGHLYHVAVLLEPIMPETSQKIIELVKSNKAPTEPLFLRKE